MKQEPGSVSVKDEFPSVDSNVVSTPKAEPVDDDTKPSPMETTPGSSTTPVQSPAPPKPRAKKGTSQPIVSIQNLLYSN